MLAQEQNFDNTLLKEKVGIASIKFWSAVHAFSKDNETVVIVLTISPRTESFDLKSQGEEILTYLENRYKEDTSPASSQKLKSLAETSATRFEDAGVLLQIAALKEEAIHLCTKEGGEVNLLRGGNTYKLISKSSPGKSLSGPIKEGDKFILSSGEEEHSSSVEISPIIKKPVTEPDTAIPPVYETPKTNGLKMPTLSLRLPHTNSPQDLLDILLRKSKKAVSETEQTPGNTVISVGVILLILLGISIGFGLVQKNKKEELSKYEARLIEAEQAFNDSLVQLPLNPRVAKDLFIKSKGLADILKEEGVKDDRLISLDTKLQENASKLLGVISVTTNTFLDLSLVRSGLDPSEIVLDQEKIAVLDKSGDRVVTVLTDATGTTVLGGNEKVGSLEFVATYAGRIFTLSEKGIIEISTSGTTSVAVQPDAQWGSPLKVRAFGSNLYIMTLEGEIWRFPAAAKGFASKQRWLGPGVILSSTPQDIALDGSVWVLSSNSRIQKYTRGAPNSFSVKDITFSEATALYTDENTESLFVLDASNARIAQLSKTGDLEKEYKSDEFKEGKDLVVSAKSGKIFLLTSSKILEIPLAE